MEQLFKDIQKLGTDLSRGLGVFVQNEGVTYSDEDKERFFALKEHVEKEVARVFDEVEKHIYK